MSSRTDFSVTSANVVRKSNVLCIPETELLRLVGELRHALETNPGGAPDLALGFLKRIAAFEENALRGTRGGLAPWQMRKIERYLRANLERCVRTKELALEVRLSVSHFCRAFKKSFGDTPHAYMLRLRLELAQKLMLKTDHPLSQIALRCGLADQAHLSKLFRRTFHDTPNAWRRRNRTESQREASPAPVHLFRAHA